MALDLIIRSRAAAAKFVGLGAAALLAAGVVAVPGQARAAEAPQDPWATDPQESETASGQSQELSGAAADESVRVENGSILPSGTTDGATAPSGWAGQEEKGPAQRAVSDADAGSAVSRDADGQESQASPEREAKPAADGQGAPTGTDQAEPQAVEPQKPAAAPAGATDAKAAAAVTEPAVTPAAEGAVPAPAAVPAPSTPTATVTVCAAQAQTAPAPEPDENIYRMYNPNSGEHFYTASIDEATHLFSVGWRWEAVAYKAASRSGLPVYRLYNPNAGNHFYTLDQGESDYLRKVGWKYENIAWYSVGTTALFRLYNPNSRIGEHLYTTSAAERDYVIRAGWHDEGTAWSVVPGSFQISGRWVVSPAYGSTQRYWIQSDANLAKGRYVNPNEGTGYAVAAYARPDGAVVRGTWYDGGGHVYLADADGRLANQSQGWLVTGAYDNGALQRYYMDGLGRAKTGEFSVDGKSYLGRTDTGYVVRGTYYLGDYRYIADNGGAITSKMSRKQIYVEWAKAIAADNSHGYSQINRLGPNYDCSALVISALRQAGYATGAANSTRDMRRELSRLGWQVVPANPNDLQYGDILLHDGVHTAIWCGNGQLVEAWEDENGSWEGYRSGDQTGQEIRVRSYYNDGWLCYLRHA